MDEKINFSTLWHAAGVPGIALAAVSIVYFLFSTHVTPDSGLWMIILNYILLGGKIFLCVWLLFLFMARFRNEHGEATRADVRHLGMLIAFLSALIFATVVMAYYRQHSEYIAEVISQSEAMMKGMPLSSASSVQQSLDLLRDNFPTMMFFSQLLYCFVFGWILSAILSTKIVKDNPF